mgnify:CR=1 FL=1
MAKDKGYLAKIGADISGFQEAMKTIKKETGTLTKELNSVSHALKLDPSNTTLQAQKLELLKQKATQASKELEELARAKETMENIGNDGTEEGAAALREYQREIEKCKRYVKEYTEYQAQLNNSNSGAGVDGINRITQSTKDATTATKNWADVFKGNLLSGVVEQGLEALLDVIKRVGTEIVTVGRDFESALSITAATFDVDKTTDEYKVLSTAAQHYGATTKYTAAQAAEALNYLALAGYTVKESIADLPAVLNLAQAGGMALGQTSDMLTDSMSALGLITADMTEDMKAEAMVTFADQLARASQKANADIENIGNAILKVGSSAKGLNKGTAELNTLVGVLADAGIKGEEGGTHIRNILKTLKENVSVFREMGVDVYDLNGNLNYLPDIIKQFGDSMSNLTNEQKDAKILDIFNSTDLASINTLLGTTSERYEELYNEIANSAGACADMASIMNDNLNGAIASCTSAWEGFSAALYTALSEDMQGVVENVAGILQELKSGIDDEDGVFNESKVEEYTERINNFIANFSETLKDKLRVLGMELLPSLMEHVNDNIQDVARNGTEIVMIFIQGLVNALPYIVQGGVRMVAGIVEGVGNALPELLPVCIKVVGEIAENIVDNVDKLYDAALTLVEGFGKALANPDTWTELVVAGGKIVVGLVSAIVENGERLMVCGWDIIQSLAKGMADGVVGYDWDSVFDGIGERVYKAIQKSLRAMPTINIYKDGKWQEWVPFFDMSKEEYDELYGLNEVYAPDTKALGTDYLEELREKTKSELEQLKIDIITERNSAEEAWVLYANSGKDSIKEYLDTVEKLSSEHRNILEGIATTARKTAVTEDEAFQNLYSDRVLNNGKYSKSYLQFAAVDDTLVEGTYNKGEITKTPEGFTITVQGYNPNKDNTEGTGTDTDVKKSVTSSKYDDTIENAMKALDDRYAIHEMNEEQYYAKRAALLERYKDEKSTVYWKYKDEIDKYYTQQEEEAAKQAEKVQEEADKKQREAEEQRSKLLKANIQDTASQIRKGKSSKDTALINEGINELKSLLPTLDEGSEAYEQCLEALNEGKTQLTDLQSTLSTLDLRQQQQDLEYQHNINERAYGKLEAAKKYYDDIKQFVESIKGTAYYNDNAQSLQKKLWSAADAYNNAYIEDYKDRVQAQIDILDALKEDFEDSVVGDKWYAEQLQLIINSIDNVDVAEAFASKLSKAQKTVQQNTESAEKAVLQAAQKYQSAIQYFRDGETLDGKDSSIINDLDKQRVQIKEAIAGIQRLREKGFSEDYIADAITPLSVSDGSRQKAIEALLGLTEEQVRQELADYEGLKSDMLELAKTENTTSTEDIANEAVDTASNALSKAISEAYKIGQDTADAFNKGITDGLGVSTTNVLNAQSALAAQGIDTQKAVSSTTATISDNKGSTVTSKPDNITISVSVAGTEVIRKTVDDMLRQNVISGGNNLYI